MSKKIIEIKDLNYSYPDGTEALHDIALAVLEGESIGVIGPNGAGKSTLLLHLNGILKGDGHIRIFDMEMNDGNLTRIRSRVGLVFQDPDNQLFMPTVFDDVAFGPVNMSLAKNEVKLSVERALKEVDMLGSIGRAPHHLSFGEKKRVSIAAVLSMKPEILALDEPTSNLDPKARHDFIRLLKSFAITKIIASHDLGMILDICDKVVILDKGRVAAGGTAREILSDAPLLEKHGLLPPLCFKNLS